MQKPKRFLKDFKEKAGIVDKKPLKVLWIFFIIVCTVMCGINLSVNSIRMAAITGGMGLWFFISAFLLWEINVKYMIYNAMTIVGIALLYFIISGGENGFSAIWVLLAPIVCMYFAGLYYGGLFCALFVVIVTVYMWTPLHEIGYDYSQTFLMRFPVVYIFDVMCCCLMQSRIIEYRIKQEELLCEAQSANQSKSDFLANMSHEIRTPLNSIMGMCELILNEDISEEVRENSNNIYISGKNLLGIINDLLDFSKIESGKIELTEEEYQLSSMLNDVINMAVARKGTKEIEFMVDCDSNIPNQLYGDELRIRQVLINLLTNAIKFTRTGGVLLKVSARKESYGVNLCFSVKDSGIGIKEENIDKIFKSFSQVDTKKNRGIEGTGLGLAISKRLVSKMGGFLNVESEYGVGTEFTVVIPQKVADSKAMIEIKEKQKVVLLAYFTLKAFEHPFVIENYKKIIANIAKNFGIKYQLSLSMESTVELLKSDIEFTHLFLGKEEYLQNREYFDCLAKKMKVVVAQNQVDRTAVSQGVYSIYKPLYVLPVGNAINGERLSFNIGINKMKEKSFIAPEARILVVDDNMMNLKVAVGILKPYKAIVRTVDSGIEALHLVKNQQFDLIFMDHMMPEMDGVETVYRIREMQEEYYQKLPIIALTANAVSGAREMFLKEGFQDFLAKPIDTSALDKILNRWLPEEKIQYKEENE